MSLPKRFLGQENKKNHVNIKHFSIAVLGEGIRFSIPVCHATLDGQINYTRLPKCIVPDKGR